MNSLVSVLKIPLNHFQVNNGRVSKKVVLCLIIIFLAFQFNQLGEIVKQSIADAYLQVSVFVGFTLLIFIGLDSYSKFNIENFLIKTKKFHVIIAALLGMLPGCGGAIIIVTQYIQGRISFGSLIAVLTATMGDAAFLLLAIEPTTGLFIFSIGAVVGMISGYIVDYIHGVDYQKQANTAEIQLKDWKKHLFLCEICYAFLV